MNDAPNRSPLRRIPSADFLFAFIFLAALFHAPVTAAETVRVDKVLDGDSLRLADGREVRLIGVNAPEFGKDGVPEEPLAREARAALARLIHGEAVRLDSDIELKDRYGRTLAHVFLADGRNVEAALLRDGLVFHVAIAPNLARLDEYHAAEAEARRARRGVWGHAYYKPREAAQSETQQGGFRFVEGRIQRISRGPHAIYFDLTDSFTLVIPHEDWHLFGGDPKRLLHRRVIARGWVTVHENRSRLRLSHPVMLEVVE